MKLLYKPFGMAVTALAGLAAARLYRRLWRALTHHEETPEAMNEDSTWGRVLVASALEGAVFAVVRAASRRFAATGFASLTGTWPGKQSSREKNEATKAAARPSAGRKAEEGRRGLRVRKSL